MACYHICWQILLFHLIRVYQQVSRGNEQQCIITTTKKESGPSELAVLGISVRHSHLTLVWFGVIHFDKDTQRLLHEAILF